MGLTEKLKTETYEMEYYKFGEGKRNLIIIPGISMKSVVASGPSLEIAFAEFTSEFTIYLFDRKLHMTDGYSVKDMADDTADAMQRLKIENAYIYAVSQGAMIAMSIAVYHKSLVHMLYISSTLARPYEKSQKVFYEWLRLADGENCKALYDSIHTNIYSQDFLEKYSREFSALSESGNKEEMGRFRILTKACIEFNIYDMLQEIHCPVFVTGAEDDKIMGTEGPRDIADKLGCQYFIYKGYSHAVYDEAPDYFSRMYFKMIEN